MGNECKWDQKALITELTQGMEIAKQLNIHLNLASANGTQQLLLQRILSSYEKALLILQWRGLEGHPQLALPTAGMLESSPSPDGSPRAEDLDKGHSQCIDASKKRKVLPTWTNQVRIHSENGFQGPIDDGYSWRKYGQKDILGAKYPRSYYRCTYRNVQSCWATKQVQRSDEDPTVFEITYKGKHTCNQSLHPTPSPSTPEKQELKQNNCHTNNQQRQQSNDMLMNFQTSLRVNTNNLDDHEQMAHHFAFPSTSFGLTNTDDQSFPLSALIDNNLLGGFSPKFISPATSESKYFSANPWEMNGFGVINDLPQSESDLTEIISTNTSVTNSPVIGLDFSIEPVGMNNFAFDNSGFFS